MAKISNTTVYPSIIPTGRDYFVLTDFEDNNQTKTCTMTDLKTFVGGGAQTLVKTLTSAEILTLNTVPIVLLTTLAGEYIQVISAAFLYNFNTITYASTSPVMALYVNNGPQYSFSMDPASITAAASNAGTFWNNADKIGVSQSYTNAGGGDSLNFRTSSSDPTLGNGTLSLSIQYRIVKFT
tara:strand:+ start:396 stop:941 length:546 start_codon:yes stop_codon:yes gene_type:complete